MEKWNLSARLPTRIGATIHSIEKIPFKNIKFPSWKSVVINKQDILLSRFSIVYENIKGLNGYITEKYLMHLLLEMFLFIGAHQI